MLCCSCGTPGHGASRCPTLDVSFPFLLPGWRAEKVGSSYVMRSPRILAVNMVNVQTGTVCGDQYSPGVLCRDETLGPAGLLPPGWGMRPLRCVQLWMI